ncbi:alkaline phosphatase family protein [Membranicola marinus]|uniref:Alkaline phosphatase family protein n=1 Tax=Membranihabitans marinus TaxID=1227546 RepID=A0A953HQZ8_9BACT|nr:alkaline phosphatase PafA [Membranihabitans marinus]MBY5956785.1 alkaline phosphatase family protein [Membranihabitans marinus]
MLKRNFLKGFVLLLLFAVSIPAFGQNKRNTDHPKLIVGVVVDQMRWDYLYRYQDRYVDGGFKRMLREGFTCENAHINYSPTVTAAGHACVYTGSVPAIHGIVSNSWYDRSIKRSINNVEDTTVQTIGAPHSGPSQSPRNLLVTTIGDELKLSNNFRSKVVGVSFKDRGAILPAGHLSDGSYWWDKSTGNFVTSTYFMDELPEWMKEFNAQKLSQEYAKKSWETLYPIDTYEQSTEDDKPYENKMIGKKTATFPYDYGKANAKPGDIYASPFGNSLTMKAAIAAIEGENLGKGEFADMIAISFSSPDALGHTVGPNAIEIEDMYLRLDQEFAELFEYLDDRYGRDGYLFFITADHGVSHSPGFLDEHNLPTGVYGSGLNAAVNKAVSDRFGIDDIVEATSSAQVYLNWENVEKQNKDVDRSELMHFVAEQLKKDPGVNDAWPARELGTAPWPEPIKSRFIKGYNAQRGGDVMFVLKSGWKGGSMNGATHGLWYPYDAHLPLVWMGWNIEPGYTNRFVGMTDIAPTLAALLKIQMPSGSIGQPILEITDKK